MRHRTTMTTAATAAAVACAAVLVPGTAAAGPRWAPAAQASVHPGVVTITDGGECTANFIFANATDVFIGQAAHCAGTGGPTQTRGCAAGSKPLGTPVTITGASKPGRLVYSSWLTMIAGGEKDANACDFNDFALVQIDRADLGKVNPSVPSFGGPTGIATGSTGFGETVLSYGSSPLRAGFGHFKEGFIIGDEGGGWSHVCYTITPGIPGDSGSAVLTGDGKALGILTSLALAPLVASNGVGDLARELDYLNVHGGLGKVSLVPGTEPFHSPALFF